MVSPGVYGWWIHPLYATFLYCFQFHVHSVLQYPTTPYSLCVHRDSTFFSVMSHYSVQSEVVPKLPRPSPTTFVLLSPLTPPHLYAYYCSTTHHRYSDYTMSLTTTHLNTNSPKYHPPNHTEPPPNHTLSPLFPTTLPLSTPHPHHRHSNYPSYLTTIT